MSYRNKLSTTSTTSTTPAVKAFKFYMPLGAAAKSGSGWVLRVWAYYVLHVRAYCTYLGTCEQDAHPWMPLHDQVHRTCILPSTTLPCV